MEIRTSSWHYRLLKFYDVDLYEIQDSCQYRRKVTWVLFVLALLTAGILVMVGDTLAWMLAMAVSLTLIAPGVPAIILISMVIGVILTTAIMLVGESHLSGRWKRRDSTKPPSTPYVVEAYRQWRDKYCTRITYKYDAPQEEEQ
jgi:hypothetical protein